ncbi:MAG: DUF177 domain-containing protein [Bacteroidales bacterium]|nr:DUF177 domain-containing protein [Bacteroidales bacterium]
MKSLKDYSVVFKGLKDGNHSFDFHVDNEFFGLFEDALYEDGEIDVVLNLNKSQQVLIFDFEMNGTLLTLCDNCLDDLSLAIDIESRLYVKFGDEYDEPTEDIIVLPREEYELNVAKFIYDIIVTSLPIRHIHKVNEDGSSECNPEMVKKLSQYLVEKEPQGEEGDGIDPRWDKLKSIIGNN